MTGNELKPTDIINGAVGPGGPSEIRYRAHVAFSTVEETLKNLEPCTIGARRSSM